MTDTSLKAPPPRQQPKQNTAAVKHQRRPSFHTRRRSQHSIASFGDIAEDVIKAPGLGSLGEDSREEPSDSYKAGTVKPKKNTHERKSSNVHMLFGEEDDEQDAMDHIVQSLMSEEVDLEALAADGQYSPRPIDLEDAPDTPVEDKKTKAKGRGQSFGGIIDLFDQDELESGRVSDPQEEIKRLKEENKKLLNEIEKSRRIKRQLEKEIETLRSGTPSSIREEIESVKTSKIRLIHAAVSEIDRLRSIIISQNRKT